jgi:hypothetical protein
MAKYDHTYYIKTKSGPKGPFPLDRIRSLREEGKLKDGSPISEEPEGPWRPLNAVILPESTSQSGVQSRSIVPMLLYSVLALSVISAGLFVAIDMSRRATKKQEEALAAQKQAEDDQAAAMLGEAKQALDTSDLDGAQAILANLAAGPATSSTAEAQAILKESQLAMSDERVTLALMELADEDFAAVLQTGTLAIDGVSHPAFTQLLQDTYARVIDSVKSQRAEIQSKRAELQLIEAQKASERVANKIYARFMKAGMKNFTWVNPLKVRWDEKSWQILKLKSEENQAKFQVITGVSAPNRVGGELYTVVQAKFTIPVIPGTVVLAETITFDEFFAFENGIGQGFLRSVLPIEVPGWQRLAGRHDQCNLKSHRQLHLFHTIGTKVAQAHP